MKEGGKDKNIGHRLIRLWRKNKNVKLEKRVSKTVCVTSILILLVAILGGHFCFALSSENYQLTNDTVGGGGVYSTSTNYTIIDYFINGLFNLFRPVAPAPAPLAGGGGGGEGKVPPPEDTTAPVISNIQVLNITQSSVRITWTTNENGSTLVDYGTMISYEMGTQTGVGGVISHEVVISNLMPSTSYHFRTRSVDAAGNSSSSLDQIFTTTADILAPIISDIVATNLTESSVTISWTTNELANSMVDYGITDAYGKGTVVDNIATTTHRISLTGLNSSTLYNFRVRAKDSANNIGSSINQTFTTLDNIAPIISSIRVVEVNSDAATILWTTDEITSGEIDYGLTRGYESGVGISAFFTKEHRLSLSDLVGNTVYHFRLTATDSAGNSSSSADFTFTTLRDALAPSNVLNLRVDPGETFMILNWTNPIERDFSGVRIVRSTTSYPRTPDGGTVIFHGLAASAVDRGLVSGTDYYYTAFSYDASENFSSGAVTFGKALGSSSLPPEIPPVAPPAPPIAQPEVPPAVSSGGEPSFVAVKIIDFQFLAAGETLVLPVIDEQIKIMVATQMVATVAAEKFSKVPELVMLKIGDSNYIFNFNREKRRFESTIMSPLKIGYFDSEISIVYDKESFQFINFKLNTVHPGLIYEIPKDGERIPVNGALVTVSKQNSVGNMEIWSSGQYSQTNPVFTNARGNYDFFVPQGFYQIKVEKEGYRVSETPVFEIKDVILNKTIELLIPPKRLLEVIEPEAPIIKNIQNVAENIGAQTIYQAKVATEEVKKVIDNPKVEKANEQIALPTIATVAVANTGTAISFLNLLNYLRFLTTQPLLLLNRRKQKGWGRVYHAFSKLPVDLAIIRLLDAKTKKIVQTRVTDKEGRYAFIVSEGKYLISVTKPGFVFPSKYLKTAKADAGMVDIYHEETIEIGKEGATVAANIPLDPIEKAVVSKKIALKKLFIKINHMVAISGMVLSLGSFIISPTKLLGGFLLAQIFLYFLFRRLSLPKKPKTWGSIYDRKTRESIKQVVVRIFETQYNKLLETQITDGKGRYVFLVGRSSYYVTFEKEGYEPRKTEIINFEKAAKENYVAMDIGLNKL